MRNYSGDNLEAELGGADECVRRYVSRLAHCCCSCQDLGVKNSCCCFRIAGVWRYLRLALIALVINLRPRPRWSKLEQNWAAALSRKDVDAVACMLATEFEDADVDGSLHSRKETLEHIPHKKPGVNQLSELRGHVEGNSGFTRGLATFDG